jgi:membrane protease YdiL (CAAX protease family)
MSTATTHPHAHRRRLRRLVAGHPVAAFLLGAYGFGWPLLTLRTVSASWATASGLAFTYVALLGSAMGVTWAVGGRPGLADFLRRFVQWRFGVRRWVFLVFALPLLTVAVAAASRTLPSVPGGWWQVAGGFLAQTFVYGALEVNLAEEGAWSGAVQSRLASRHGVLGGALRTAPLFVAMHVPPQFSPGWTWAGVALGVAVLAVVATFFRYLLGETLEATGGSPSWAAGSSCRR